MAIVTYYKNRAEAELNCGEGQKIAVVGSAIRRYEVVSCAEYGRRVARVKDDFKGSDTQTRSGSFLGI